MRKLILIAVLVYISGCNDTPTQPSCVDETGKTRRIKYRIEDGWHIFRTYGYQKDSSGCLHFITDSKKNVIICGPYDIQTEYE